MNQAFLFRYLKLWDSNDLGLYFQARDGKKLFVYLDEVNTNLGDEYISLLKIFANNISVSFENLALIERLDQLAYQDAILGLPNRNAFSQSYNQLAKTQPYFSVIALHIDSLGQSIGVFGIALVNQALLLIHNKLSQLLSPHIIAYDGKADLLIISQNPNRDLETIQSFFKNKLEVGQVQLALNVRIAVVDADENSDADLALRNIVSTMAHSKASGNVSVNYYDQSITTGLARRLKLQSALSDAVEQRKGIETFLQAKVRCIDSEIVGAEALCRWHFEEQYVSPCDFIPIAEASGLITSLTDIVLENVSNFALDRRKKGLKPLSVAVNLSVHSFLNNNFADQLLAKVQSLGLNKLELEFEITESVVMSDPKQVIEQLKKINNAGFKLAIDDFGTGYSSLNYLDQLPVQCIKIDKAFVDPLNISNARGSLAATAISMAEQLKMYVVAEGIETKQQHDALTFLGCDVCQGYYFAKPQSFSDFRHGLGERGSDGSALVNSFH